MDISPLVSVIIPAYNPGGGLMRAIDSLFQQTYKNWEAIIIDDGSDQNLDGPLSTFTDSRIKYFRLNHNAGRGNARQVGLEKAAGQFISFLDADDTYTQEKLELQVKAFQKYPRAALISSNLSLTSSGKTIGKLRFQRSNEPKLCSPLDRPKVSLPVPFAPSMIRATVAKSEGFRRDLVECEDFDFLLRLLLRNYYVVLPQALYIYDISESDALNRIRRRLLVTMPIVRSLPGFGWRSKLPILAQLAVKYLAYSVIRFFRLEKVFHKVKTSRQAA